MIDKVKKLLKNPKLIILYALSLKVSRIIPDLLYIKTEFRLAMGKKLDLKNPKSYNEKLQWLKLYDRKPEYTQMVDKYEVRKFISKSIGEEYLIPLLGVYDSFDEIDFDALPNQFVLKPNHTSGNVFICRDKSKINYEDLKKTINKWLNRRYYWVHREWPYKNIRPRIICEKYMVDESGVELKDYKFFCFNGEPKSLFVATDRGIDTRFDFFDLEFNHLPFMQHYKNGTKKINRPPGFDEMIRLSSKLSKGIPHVRVDFYDINGRIYFGELTFYHFSGYEKFEPEKYDRVFGDWLQLPQGN
ncbi:ATP-grasp fold amidoligase family protein [Schinkia azotoformans]|uniref:ATP-grasp fold amidoligase family protein n=1 Tax=Schinkia azotoformans TaxID=1454 RepID=UPI002E1C6EBA|nr:ATP-grasp fold amidoligase family protein [Schinkia azotoformans]